MRNCRAAECSEYLEISRISRVIFFWHRCHTFVCTHFPLFRCSGRLIPFGVLLHGPTLIFVVKALSSVKHGGPSTKIAAVRRDLPGSVHRSLHVVLPNVRLRTCSDILRHHCLLPPHDVKDGTFFLKKKNKLPFPVHLVAFATFSSIFPVILAWHCALSLLSFGATGKPLTCWRPALPQEAVRGTFLRLPFSLWYCFVSSFSLIGVALH